MYQITIKELKKEMVKSREFKQLSDKIDEEGKNEYGYVNEEKEEEVSNTILEQRVEELDLEAVIKVVNKIS